MNQNCSASFPRTAQLGATLVEYAVVTALLLGAFVVAASILETRSTARGNASVGTVKEMVPCGPGSPLSGESCL